MLCISCPGNNDRARFPEDFLIKDSSLSIYNVQFLLKFINVLLRNNYNQILSRTVSQWAHPRIFIPHRLRDI